MQDYVRYDIINAYIIAVSKETDSYNYSGEIKNLEPEKCKEIKWIDINNLPENTIKGIKNKIINVYNNVYYCKD